MEVGGMEEASSSKKHLKEADRLFELGDYHHALEAYLSCDPVAVASDADAAAPVVKRNRNRLLTALSRTLDSLGSQSRGHLDWSTLSELAKRVYSFCKDDDVAMTMLGVKCLDEGIFEQAQYFLTAALRVDPECLVAKENLRALYDRMIHRWHFHMLNDVQRNSAYSKALHLALQDIPDSSVLDIGSGTGLLSMMAVRSGAGEVFAVELDSTMVAMSRDILASNGMAERVRLFHCPSTSLSVPTHIPHRVNLVVTEIVDAGLLGEHIIPTLRHAWRELLLPPPPPPPPPSPSTGHKDHTHMSGGHVIPCGATVYAMGIQCQEVRKKSRLIHGLVAGLAVDCVRLEGSCKAREVCHEEGGGAGAPGVLGVSGDLEREPYSCECLNHIRGGFTPLTSPQPLLEFDFSQPEIPLPSNVCPMAVTQRGELDAVAVWFDLTLFADISLSTSPSWDLSWEQAVFPINSTLTCQHRAQQPQEEEGQGVEQGDVIILHASCSDTQLRIEAEIERALPAPQSQWQQLPVFYVERGDLLRLNDCHYTSSYQQAMAKALAHVNREAVSEGSGDESGATDSSEAAECLLLDVCEGLSLFGLAAAKLGADFVLVSQLSPSYGSLLKYLAAHNEVSDKVRVRQQEIAGHDGAHLQKLVAWDVVVSDLVSPQGNLRSGVFEKLAHIRAGQLFPDGVVIIPGKLCVKAHLLSSPALRAQSCVLGTIPTLGFQLAPVVNHYQVTHFVDVDLSAYPLQLLSNEAPLLEIDLNSLKKDPMKVSRAVSVEVVADGNITGVAYWFELHLDDKITVTTAPRGYPESHWHQCVFMLAEDRRVCKGDMVTIHSLLRDSCLDISLQ